MQEKSTLSSKARMLKTTALGTAISITLQLTSCYAMAFANTTIDDKAGNQLASTAGLELLGPGGTSPSEAFDIAPARTEQLTLATIHESLDTQEKSSSGSKIAIAEPVSALREAPQETTSVVDPNAAKDGKMSLAAATGMASTPSLLQLRPQRQLRHRLQLLPRRHFYQESLLRN
ncbi:unnamed protein product [Sphagnum jensenii]|uniref:Uncharacterized protein n=1 Tax=Sphagnum jensenii TaxID=128206 RepID=A0ABP0VC63_9BRYO